MNAPLKPRRSGASGFVFACAMAAGSSAWAAPHTPCVTNATELSAEIAKAGNGGINNDADTHINLAVGVYPITSFLYYLSHETFTLDITGGFNSDCSKQVTQNPIYTVLSGVGGGTEILDSESYGDVSLRFLTFKGGNGAGDGTSALRMNAAYPGQIIIDYDIFTANTGGVVVSIGDSSLVQLDGNLFYSNTGTLATFYALNTVQFYAINNTFTQNALADSTRGAATLWVEGDSSSSASAALSNNIFFNNSFTNTHGSTDYDMHLVGSVGTTGSTVRLEKNIANLASVSAATLVTFTDLPMNTDPQFVSSTDFPLMSNSPGIAAGTLTAPGGLPVNDIEGNPRTYNGAVDLGAYEHGDEIFADGFSF